MIVSGRFRSRRTSHTRAAGRDRELISWRSSDEPFVVPHLLDVEVVSALRNLTAGGRLDPHRIDEYLNGLAMLGADRYSHLPLMGRVWELGTTLLECISRWPKQ